MKAEDGIEAGAGTARAYHHGHLRTALIDVGLGMLAEDDDAELNLRELARRLGVSSAAVYRHFATREDLRSAVAAEGFRRLAAACATARAELGGGVAAIRATGRAYIRFARRNPALFRTMFERVSPPYRTEERSAAIVAALASIYADVAQALGLGLDDPCVSLGALHAWSHVHGVSVLLLDGKLDQGPVDPECLVYLVADGYQPPSLESLRRASVSKASRAENSG